MKRIIFTVITIISILVLFARPFFLVTMEEKKQPISGYRSVSSTAKEAINVIGAIKKLGEYLDTVIKKRQLYKIQKTISLLQAEALLLSKALSPDTNTPQIQHKVTKKSITSTLHPLYNFLKKDDKDDIDKNLISLGLYLAYEVSGFLKNMQAIIPLIAIINKNNTVPSLLKNISACTESLNTALSVIIGKQNIESIEKKITSRIIPTHSEKKEDKEELIATKKSYLSYLPSVQQIKDFPRQILRIKSGLTAVANPVNEEFKNMNTAFENINTIFSHIANVWNDTNTGSYNVLQAARASLNKNTVSEGLTSFTDTIAETLQLLLFILPPLGLCLYQTETITLALHEIVHHLDKDILSPLGILSAKPIKKSLTKIRKSIKNSWKTVATLEQQQNIAHTLNIKEYPQETIFYETKENVVFDAQKPIQSEEKIREQGASEQEQQEIPASTIEEKESSEQEIEEQKELSDLSTPPAFRQRQQRSPKLLFPQRKIDHFY